MPAQTKDSTEIKQPAGPVDVNGNPIVSSDDFNWGWQDPPKVKEPPTTSSAEDARTEALNPTHAFTTLLDRLGLPEDLRNLLFNPTAKLSKISAAKPLDASAGGSLFDALGLQNKAGSDTPDVVANLAKLQIQKQGFGAINDLVSLITGNKVDLFSDKGTQNGK